MASVYASLGFDQIADSAFKALVLARIIEPTSKADTVRVLAELGVPGPSRVTLMRCLKRVIERDYRTKIAQACFADAIRHGGLALVPVKTPNGSLVPEPVKNLVASKLTLHR